MFKALLPGGTHPKRLSVLALVFVLANLRFAREADEVNFDRDIRPILAENCFKCHGPDAKQRQAELRLDLRESATKAAESGTVPIVPSNAATSELVRRINANNDRDRMPPISTHKFLTADQKNLLARWINKGATYEPHWAFVSPVAPKVPVIRGQGFRIENSIDAFIAERLQREGMIMSPEADKATLIRRVAVDLTGLPPTVAELDAFLADTSPDAYIRMVDRLLAS